jgi:tRNA U55 pseudouridine synthase TruB
MIGKDGRSGLLKGFNGIILAYKPSGITSYDVIRGIRKVFF